MQNTAVATVIIAERHTINISTDVILIWIFQKLNIMKIPKEDYSIA